MIPAIPADKYPADTTIADDTDAPAQRAPSHAPGPRQTNIDSRPHHAKVEADEWTKVVDAVPDSEDAVRPLNSPDVPYTLKLRVPIKSSKGTDGGMLKELVISPPRVDAFVTHGPFVRTVSETFENKSRQETKVISYGVTLYDVLLKHLSTATGISIIELSGMRAADAEQAAVVLFSMSRGIPFR